MSDTVGLWLEYRKASCLEGDVGASLSERMSQKEHIIHPYAQRQKWQHLWKITPLPLGLCAKELWVCSGVSVCVYLCGGCVKRQPQQRA